MPIKWVDTNKGTEDNTETRCRLVARDFRGADRETEDPFAATSPWKVTELLMSHATDRTNGKANKIDVKKAHLNSERAQEVLIPLPEEVGARQDKVGQAQALALRIQTSSSGFESALHKHV